jgi:HlyD family secretion protein
MAFFCSLPVIAGLFGACAAAPPLATGYVEGEYVLIAPVETGRIDWLAKRRGERVAKGEILVTMETADADIAVHEAEAALDEAKAQLANLKQGRRPEEIDVIQASLLSAKAQATEAQRVFDREDKLAKRGINAKADLDQAATALEQADALVSQANAKLANAHWRLEHRQLKVPSAGVIDDIVRREGEVAGPSQPVISFLPDGAVKLRLYAGEAYMSKLKLGSTLAVRCDGCAEGLLAKISYISNSPEFTPPVIYSLENRQKLVYLIEARPEGDASDLKPGQIVDVVLAGDT